MSKAIRAVPLDDTQLKMLDIGAPVIVACTTLSGETVMVRLQTRTLAPGVADAATPADAGHPARRPVADGCWQSHGAYVAIMPSGVDYGR